MVIIINALLQFSYSIILTLTDIDMQYMLHQKHRLNDETTAYEHVMNTM